MLNNLFIILLILLYNPINTKFVSLQSSLKSYLSNYLTNKDIIIDKTYSNIYNFEEIIIVTRIGEIKKSKLEEINKIIDLANKNIHGFINF